MTPTAAAGALLHTVFHAFAKSALFLTAGIFIYQNGKTKVTEYRGIGCQMPVTLWCYTIASLALIGIPPTSGFISKWYLALGALESNVGGLRYAGPVILLISAFLTAGYLLPITLRGFFPGKEYEGNRREIKEADKKMLIPLVALALLSLLPGIFPNPLVHSVLKIAGSVL